MGLNIRKKTTKRKSTKTKPVKKTVIPKKTLSYEERLSRFAQVTDSLEVYSNGDKLCVKNKTLGDAVKMGKRFGSPSAFGEAWLGYTFEKKGSKFNVAIKKMTLSTTDLGQSFTREQLMSGSSSWGEMAAYIVCTTLVMAKICPNLPVLYKYFWCPNCKFVNKAIKGKTVRPCLLVVNELADYDLKTFIKNKLHVWNPALVDNCVFQIAAGLYSLKKFYNMTHNDLHMGNVLVHEIPAGGYWHYKIDGKNYYIPNMGYLFVLWDFGMVHIPDKIKGQPEFYTVDDTPIPSETDIGRICSVMSDPLYTKRAKKYLGAKRHQLLGNIMKREKLQQPLEEILLEYFPGFHKKPKEEHIIDTYNMDYSKKQLRNAHSDELKYLVR